MKRSFAALLVVFAAAMSMIFGTVITGATETADVSGFRVTVPEDGVSFHTQLQEEALAAGADHISEYSNLGKEELSIPAGVTISWEYEGDASGKYILTISDSEDLSDAQVWETENDSFVIQNLQLDTTYYFTVAVGDAVSEVYSFTTSDQGPRNLYVDGITNVRDLGGWTTNDGGTIRQNRIIRCGELNTSETTDPCITDLGKDALRALGVRTEIDFRRTEDNEQGGIIESPLGADINYYSEPIGYITDITPDTDSILHTFQVLADENNYPVIYHCKIGTDRTGLITYLVLSLCDVRMDDIYLDYAFSNLGHIQGKRDPNRLDKMVNDNFADYAGATPQETARNYLSSIGVTDEEMDAIVSILVEK